MSLDHVVAVVLIGGFAVQQILQVFDPIIVHFSKLGTWQTEAERKKAIMVWSSIGIGIAIACAAKLSVLAHISPEYGGWADMLLAGVVIGSGAEGTNTFLKYIQYVKDGRKADAKPAVEVVIVPANPSLAVGQSQPMFAVVRNAEDQSVEWIGVGINDKGVFTASTAGAHTIVARSRQHPTVSSQTTVTVRAA